MTKEAFRLSLLIAFCPGVCAGGPGTYQMPYHRIELVTRK